MNNRAFIDCILAELHPRDLKLFRTTFTLKNNPLAFANATDL